MTDAKSLEAFQRAHERVKDSAQVASRIIASQLGLGETEAAREALDAALKRFPNFPPLHYLRAVDAHTSGNNVEALSAVRDVLKIQANHWQALLLAGSILFTEGENLQAESLISRASNAQPSSLQVRKVLASALIKLGDGSQARDGLEPILEANINDEQVLGLLANAYLMLGEYPKGTELLEQATRLSNGGSHAKPQLAISYLAEGKVDQGESTLRSVVELDSSFVKVAFVLVYALLNKQDWDGAIASAQKLADAQTDNALPLVLIGNAFAGKGDVAEAKTAYNKAFKRHPDFIIATFQLAQIAAVARDFDTAVKLDREVLEKVPGQETAASNLARILIASKERNQAIELLEDIRSTALRAVRTRLMLAGLYRAEQRWPLALELAQEAERIAPEDKGMLLVLARAHAANGASQQAIATFEKPLEREPDFTACEINALNPKVADTYGWILVRTGEREKGLAILEEAARRAPFSMELQYHIAATLEQIGDKQRAIQIAKLVVANRQEFSEKA